MKTIQLIALLLFVSISLDAQEPRTVQSQTKLQDPKSGEVKKQLLEMNQSLQGDLATMDSHILNLSKLNDELESTTKDYSEKLLKLIDSNIAPDRGQSDLKVVLKEIKELHFAFNLQHLALQQDMQSQNRQFTMVSNIMKTKHDTEKNAINNIR